MGILKNITNEYFGEIAREEDIIEMNGVETRAFEDKNGTFHKHGYHILPPKTRLSGDLDRQRRILWDLLKELMEKRGDGCDLNDVDVSDVKDMSYIFQYTSIDFDISGWDTSNVWYMTGMFRSSKFNGDISRWNVWVVDNMEEMFWNSEFNNDISDWNVGEVTNMKGMFCKSEFNGDISRWKVDKVMDMTEMFANSKFTCENGSISDWKVSRKCKRLNMFKGTPILNNLPPWYKR